VNGTKNSRQTRWQTVGDKENLPLCSPTFSPTFLSVRTIDKRVFVNVSQSKQAPYSRDLSDTLQNGGPM